MTAQWWVPRSRRDVPNAWLHSDGSFLVPLTSPPSWAGSGDFYYVSKDLNEAFDPLCCLRVFDRPRGHEWRRIVVDGPPDRSLIVGVVAALETPSGYTLPWTIQQGDETFASLHPPPWLTFAPDLGYGSVSYVVHRVDPETLEETRQLRGRQVERAMRSALLLDAVRWVTGRRMMVQWFEGDAQVGQSSFESGRELFDALTDPATRNRPHLIRFPDGWYVDGVSWLSSASAW